MMPIDVEVTWCIFKVKGHKVKIYISGQFLDIWIDIKKFVSYYCTIMLQTTYDGQSHIEQGQGQTG